MRVRIIAAIGLVAIGVAGWWLGHRSATLELPRLVRLDGGSHAPFVPPPLAGASRDGAAAAPRGDDSRTGARVVVRARWGAGAGELGRKRDAEAVAVGPMSLVVDGSGRPWVLDQVNGRIARWSPDGRPLPPIPIHGEAAQDLALGRRNSVAVLDRLAAAELALYGEDGRALGAVGIVGRGIPEGGGTTGLFTDRDGNFYVEREHSEVVRIADADGRADAARESVPGRPSRDGLHFIAAAIAERAAGTVLVRAANLDGKPAWQQLVPLGAPVLYLSLLDSDRAGNVYLAGHVGHESAEPPYRVVDEELVIVSLAPTGEPRARLVLAAVPSEEEAFRELTVGDDGTVYRMVRSESGVTIEAYQL
jgi:hypothetical protein